MFQVSVGAVDECLRSTSDPANSAPFGSRHVFMCLKSAGETRDSSGESVQEFSFKQVKKNQALPSDFETKAAFAGSLTVSKVEIQIPDKPVVKYLTMPFYTVLFSIYSQLSSKRVLYRSCDSRSR